MLQTEKGIDSRVPIHLKRDLTVRETEVIQQNRSRMIIGSKETVHSKLEQLAERTQTDQFLVLTNIYDNQEKIKSFERLATIMSS